MYLSCLEGVELASESGGCFGFRGRRGMGVYTDGFGLYTQTRFYPASCACPNDVDVTCSAFVIQHATLLLASQPSREDVSLLLC